MLSSASLHEADIVSEEIRDRVYVTLEEELVLQSKGGVACELSPASPGAAALSSSGSGGTNDW